MQSDFAIMIPVGPGPRPWLMQSLRSLAAQPVVVSVAVCALERSADVSAALKQFEGMIDYVRIGSDEGQSAAINEGWRALDARYYGWLNDDDMLHPEALLRALAAFSQGADVVHGRTDVLAEGMLRTGYGDVPVTASLLRDNSIAQPSTFVSRTALEIVDLQKMGAITCSLNPDLHYAMDWDLWRRLYASGAKFTSIADSLSITRWHGKTKTAAFERAKYREYFSLLRRDNSWLSASWTTLVMMLHTRTTCGRKAGLSRLMLKLLHKIHSKRRTKNPETGAECVEIFHYHDDAETLLLSDAQQSKVLLQPGEGLRVEQGRIAVPFT